MFQNRNHEHFSDIILMFCHIQSCRGKPRLRKSVINKIPEIHSVSNSVGNEIKIKQKFLIIFLRVNDQRKQTEQNKKRIHIQNRCGIERRSVIRNTEIIGYRINRYKFSIEKPKQKTRNLIKEKRQKQSIKKSKNLL